MIKKINIYKDIDDCWYIKDNNGFSKQENEIILGFIDIIRMFCNTNNVELLVSDEYFDKSMNIDLLEYNDNEIVYLFKYNNSITKVWLCPVFYHYFKNPPNKLYFSIKDKYLTEANTRLKEISVTNVKMPNNYKLQKLRSLNIELKFAYNFEFIDYNHNKRNYVLGIELHPDTSKIEKDIYILAIKFKENNKQNIELTDIRLYSSLMQNITALVINFIQNDYKKVITKTNISMIVFIIDPKDVDNKKRDIVNIRNNYYKPYIEYAFKKLNIEYTLKQTIKNHKSIFAYKLRKLLKLK